MTAIPEWNKFAIPSWLMEIKAKLIQKKHNNHKILPTHLKVWNDQTFCIFSVRTFPGVSASHFLPQLAKFSRLLQSVPYYIYINVASIFWQKCVPFSFEAFENVQSTFLASPLCIHPITPVVWLETFKILWNRFPENLIQCFVMEKTKTPLMKRNDLYCHLCNDGSLCFSW